MPVDVRVVGPEDWAVWRELRLEALQDTPIGFLETYDRAARLDESGWRARLARGAYCVVAEQDAEPVGMSLGFLDEGQPTVGAVFIRPQARGRARGVLAAMVDRVADWAQRVHGAHELALWVHEDNARAQAAYERLGFVATGETLPYDLDPTRREQRMIRSLTTESG
ncbi:MAG: family N-acetyltransferase [Frankiales bacterium]|nr:family N-acetyltransferase [Frankiales bacterium]